MNQPSTCATRELHISEPYGSPSVVTLKCTPSVWVGPSWVRYYGHCFLYIFS